MSTPNTSKSELYKETQQQLGELHREAAIQLTMHRARIIMLVSSVVQPVLAVHGEEKGILFIAKAMNTDPASIWELLAGEYLLNLANSERVAHLVNTCVSVSRQQAGEHPQRVPPLQETLALAQHLFQQGIPLEKKIANLRRQMRQLQQRRMAEEQAEAAAAEEAKATEAAVKAEAALRAAEVEQPKPPFSPPSMDDTSGYLYKPDPLAATSEEEFIAAMRSYRVWAGNPSLREMARRCGTISYSSFSNMLNGTTIPKKLRFVHTFVQVLGGTEQDLKDWGTAWRKFALQQDDPPAVKDLSPSASPVRLRLTGS